MLHLHRHAYAAVARLHPCIGSSFMQAISCDEAWRAHDSGHENLATHQTRHPSDHDWTPAWRARRCTLLGELCGTVVTRDEALRHIKLSAGSSMQAWQTDLTTNSPGM